MNLEQLFSLCGSLAMIGWLGLLLAPRWHITRDWVAPVIAPLMIGSLYIWLMTSSISLAPGDAGFGSLAGVMSLFTVSELALAGWIHYLAFDLFVGAWVVKDAQAEGIHHPVLIPCLLATFMAGPGGLVLYWVVKLSYRAARRSPVNEA